jgi:hypothetical protein
MRKGIPTAGYVCNGRFGSEGGHYMNDAPKGRVDQGRSPQKIAASAKRENRADC